MKRKRIRRGLSKEKSREGDGENDRRICFYFWLYHTYSRIRLGEKLIDDPNLSSKFSAHIR